MTAPPLRILYVIGSLDPRTGGPASSAPNTWVSARRAGVEVTVAVVDVGDVGPGEQAIRDRLAREGIALRSFRVARDRGLAVRWGVSWGLAWRLFGLARDADIVHAHGAWMFSTLAALAAAKLAGTPFVLTPHESMTRRDVAWGATPLKVRIKRAVKWLLHRSARLIVYASEIEARDSRNDGDETAIRAAGEVIYHPVIDDPSDVATPRPEGLPPDPLRLGFLGRFDGKKNIELLLDAVAALPGTALVLAGGGSDDYERALRARAERLGLASRVRWLGFIAAEARPGFFEAIDLLVMPSAYEGFGMVAAEALAQAVPVAVTESCGIAELVLKYECGVVVRADRDALVAAIGALGRDPARLARYSTQAVTMCRAELSARDYGVRLAALYRRCLVQPE